MARIKKQMRQLRTGLNPLDYLGVEPCSPTNYLRDTRDPTVKDQGNIGDEWQNEITNEVFKLVNISLGVYTWLGLVGDVKHIADDAGALTSADTTSSVQVAGGLNLNTVAGVSTITINLENSVSLAGALTINSLVTAGVVQSSATGVVFSDTGASGEILVAGGIAPVWSYLESALGTMVIRDTANHINLEAHDGTSIATIDCDVEEAHPNLGAITISGRTLQLNTDGSVPNTVLINLDASPTIVGTLTVGDLVAASPGVVFTTPAGGTYAANGTDGQLIIADAAGGPAWGNFTSSGGTLTVTTGPNILDLKLA